MATVGADRASAARASNSPASDRRQRYSTRRYVSVRQLGLPRVSWLKAPLVITLTKAANIVHRSEVTHLVVVLANNADR
jgi:hypothetical protein